MQSETLTVRDFLQLQAPILDVRSPGEYAQGHLPGALSFPLFTDEERAAVGTCYKNQGPQLALELGLKYTGPKMAGFVRKARQLAAGGGLGVHCWRGGQRSKSMARLLRLAGIPVSTLQGGYKAYRQQVLDDFSQRHFQLRLLGGRTGTGKTRILHALRASGAQILDLEALANHKGSAFGHLGEAPQPTVEHFENLLHQALGQLDAERPVWVENESHSIGRVFIPQGFWQQMKQAPLFQVEIPHALRVAQLIQNYADTDVALLETAFKKIEKKLGGQHLKRALEALQSGDFAQAAEIALVYYDKTYQHCLDQNHAPQIHRLVFEHADPERIAAQLLNLSLSNQL
jgi:tRNA 2-selenouridine synthase